MEIGIDSTCKEDSFEKELVFVLDTVQEKNNLSSSSHVNTVANRKITPLIIDTHVEILEVTNEPIQSITPSVNDTALRMAGYDYNIKINNAINENKMVENPMEDVSESNLFENLTFMELARSSWTNEAGKQYYTRGCLWSPDGTCILTAVNLDGMHIFEIPLDLYERKSISNKRPLDVLQSVVHVKEGGTVYDYCWYPFMNSNIPETCCWLATRQHEPIHMWDAFNGELRCSYRGYDVVDEVETAISVTFSIDGSKVLGGYKKTIKVFDTHIPGRKYIQIDTKTPCSCFALHSTSGDIIATGSWKTTINMYDLRSPSLGCLVTLEKHVAGVTYIKFSSCGKFLYSSARKDNQLIQWDMRKFSKPVRILERNVRTNQRMYFDLSPQGQWLISGDTDGSIHVWDTQNDFKELLFPLRNDCCNGVGLHPTKPILSTTCGQYHFLTENNGETIKMYENSLVFWWYGKLFKT